MSKRVRLVGPVELDCGQSFGIGIEMRVPGGFKRVGYRFREGEYSRTALMAASRALRSNKMLIWTRHGD